MQILPFLIVISALISCATSTGAAETEIVGKSKAGQRFTFMYGFPADLSRLADFPLPSNASAEQTSLDGMRVTANGTAKIPAIGNESQCVLLSTRDALFISCASQPKNALSGVVYKHTGISKSGDGMYSCVVGCSNRAPRTLLEVTLPSGC